MGAFHVTYDVVTPESAEHGDYAESGFAIPGGWRFPMPDDCCGPAAAAFAAEHDLTLREAVNMVSCVEQSGESFYEIDGTQDYQTGAETRLALHCPDNITASSLRRVARLLGCKGR